jgi:RND family efflux transporter MFP subunit
VAARTQVKQQKLELRQAQRDLKRSQQLVASRATTVEEHQRRETDAAIADARLSTNMARITEIESQLTLIDVRLEDMVVRAPYDGRVVERHAEPGEWIHPGEPFITLVSSGKVEAWLDVPERFAQLLGEDETRIEVHGFDGSLTPQSVKRVPDVHTRTRTFPLVLTFDDRQGQLTAGMSVDAWLPVGERTERLTVPKNAVIRSGRTAYVYKAVDQDRRTIAVQTPIEVAFETGERVALAAGDLEAGDRVIVEGNERILPGSEIVVATPLGDEQYAASGR